MPPAGESHTARGAYIAARVVVAPAAAGGVRVTSHSHGGAAAYEYLTGRLAAAAIILRYNHTCY